MKVRARTVISESSDSDDRYRHEVSIHQKSNHNRRVDLDTLERGEAKYLYQERNDDSSYVDKYDHRHYNNNYCCWLGGWGFWRWLVVFNTISVVVFIGLYIILISNHGGLIGTSKLDKNIPIGQQLKYVPQSVKLQTSQTKIQTKSYKFNLNGVFARYPADGGVIEGLKRKMKGTTEFCCNYEVKDKNRSLTKQACASTTAELKFQIQAEDDKKNGYMIVSAQKDMVGAQCTLTWSVNKIT